MRKFISRVCTAIVFTVCIGGILYMGLRPVQEKPTYGPIMTMGFMNTPDVDRIINKIKVENVFINDIYQRQELITMEVDLNVEIFYDDSWTDGLFRKRQKLVYFGKGKYSTDLNLIEASDILFDHDKKVVTVEISKPRISSIEIDELQTMITPTDNGIFRFGEVKLPAVDYNRLTLEAKSMMRAEMEEKELMDLALEKTEGSVKDLYEGFLVAAGFDEYVIEISWKLES